ncbi:MAG: S9 family peptidase [Saprospiraceae bacterium]|nr:S9 family peptidase [Saprospiraceae bacterium]
MAYEVPPLIDREIFFGDPEISGAQVSPDGKWMSFVKPLNSVRNIWVKRFREPFERARPLTAVTARPISDYFWTRSGRYIVFVQDQGGDENYSVYAVDLKQAVEAEGIPIARALTQQKNIRVYLYGVARKKPNVIFVGINDRDPSWHDPYALNVRTGTLKRLHRNTGRIVQWVFDRNDVLRVALRSNEDGSTEFLRLDSGKMIPFYHCGPLESAHCVNFHEDGNRVYAVSNRGAQVDLMRLLFIHIETGQEELVESDPEMEVDFGAVSFSDVDNRIIATQYTGDKTRIYWRDADFEMHYRKLEQKFPKCEVAIRSMTRDENRWLVAVFSDRDSGSIYSYSRRSGRCRFEYRPRPQLDPNVLSEMQVVRYPSSDGMEIQAYLTLPLGWTANQLPLVVHPHGGPWTRDVWGYNPLAQFLANRGYAVLQMNYRGSTGFGKAFLDAGNREWGLKMQDDITYGVYHLVSTGLVDPKRVAILGGSYGGYASLAGAAFTPDVYACAISKVGPSSLLTLLASIPPYWEAGRKMFHLRMGDPTTPEGEEHLKRASPLYSVQQIRCPVMIVQGANDPRVKQAESDQIVEALHKNKKEVAYLCAEDEGHGFVHPVNNMAFLAAAEAFLARHLGGRFQETMPDEVRERLRKMDRSPTAIN